MTTDRLEQPPRLTGDPSADVAALGQYVSEMWRNLILERGIPQTIDQPDTAIDPDTGIITSFPIGFIMGTVDSRNPVDYLGYGTWERFGNGKVLVGVDETDTVDLNFDTVEKVGGAKLVTPTGTVAAPVFTGSALGTHSHGVGTIDADAHDVTTTPAATGIDLDAITAIADHVLSGSTDAVSAGTPAGTNSAPAFTGAPQSTLQPYLTVFYWKRTA